MTMTTAAGAGGRTVTINDVFDKDTEDLTIPFREIDSLESITLGFRQGMLTLKDDNGDGGEVLTSAGLGGESIIIEYTDKGKTHQAMIRGTDLLIAYVRTIDPKAADNMQKAVDEFNESRYGRGKKQ